jgi:hypothetical protein
MVHCPVHAILPAQNFASNLRMCNHNKHENKEENARSRYVCFKRKMYIQKSALRLIELVVGSLEKSFSDGAKMSCMCWTLQTSKRF